MFDVGFVGPQAVVLAEPVVDPGALAPALVVQRLHQASQVVDVPRLFCALVGDDPDAALFGEDLAAAVGVGADTADLVFAAEIFMRDAGRG